MATEIYVPKTTYTDRLIASKLDTWQLLDPDNTREATQLEKQIVRAAEAKLRILPAIDREIYFLTAELVGSYGLISLQRNKRSPVVQRQNETQKEIATRLDQLRTENQAKEVSWLFDQGQLAKEGAEFLDRTTNYILVTDIEQQRSMLENLERLERKVRKDGDTTEIQRRINELRGAIRRAQDDGRDSMISNGHTNGSNGTTRQTRGSQSPRGSSQSRNSGRRSQPRDEEQDFDDEDNNDNGGRSTRTTIDPDDVQIRTASTITPLRPRRQPRTEPTDEAQTHYRPGTDTPPTGENPTATEVDPSGPLSVEQRLGIISSLNKTETVSDFQIENPQDVINLTPEEIKQVLTTQPMTQDIKKQTFSLPTVNFKGGPLNYYSKLNVQGRTGNRLIPMEFMLSHTGFQFFALSTSEQLSKQAKVYTTFAKTIIGLHKQNPSHLSEWLSAQDTQTGEISNLAFLRDIDAMKGDVKLRMVDGLPGGFQAEWVKRMDELEQSLGSDQLLPHHLDWLDFLSRSINLEKLLHIAQTKWGERARVELPTTTPTPSIPESPTPPTTPTAATATPNPSPITTTPATTEESASSWKVKAYDLQKSLRRAERDLNELKSKLHSGFKGTLNRFGFYKKDKTITDRQAAIKTKQTEIEGIRNNYIEARDHYSALEALQTANASTTEDVAEYRRLLAEKYIDSAFDMDDPLTHSAIAEAQKSKLLLFSNYVHRHPWRKLLAMWGLNAAIGLTIPASPPVSLALFGLRAGLGAIGTEAAIHNFQTRRRLKTTIDQYKKGEIERMLPEDRAKRAALIYSDRIRWGNEELTEAERKLLAQTFIENLHKEDITRSSAKDKVVTVLNPNIADPTKPEPETWLFYDNERKAALKQSNRDKAIRYAASAAIGIGGTVLMDQLIGGVHLDIKDWITSHLGGVNASVEPVAVTTPPVVVGGAETPLPYPAPSPLPVEYLSNNMSFLDPVDPTIIHPATHQEVGIHLANIPDHHTALVHTPTGTHEYQIVDNSAQALRENFGIRTEVFEGPDKLGSQIYPITHEPSVLEYSSLEGKAQGDLGDYILNPNYPGFSEYRFDPFKTNEISRFLSQDGFLREAVTNTHRLTADEWAIEVLNPGKIANPDNLHEALLPHFQPGGHYILDANGNVIDHSGSFNIYDKVGSTTTNQDRFLAAVK